MTGSRTHRARPRPTCPGASTTPTTAEARTRTYLWPRRWSAGCGAGSRWFGLGVARGPAGEELVVGAAGEVPLDAFPDRAFDDAAGEAAGVHDGVVPLAQQGPVAQVGGSEVGPVHQVMRVGP